MAYFVVDCARHPIIDIEIGGLLNEVQTKRALGEVKELIDRGERFSVIANLAQATVPDLTVRSLFRMFVMDNQTRMNHLSVSCALIIHNKPVTMAVKAVYAATTTFYPRRVFQVYEEGLIWTQRELKQAKVHDLQDE